MRTASSCTSRDERIAARLIAAIDSLIPGTAPIAIYAGRFEVAIEGKVEVSIDLTVYERLPDRAAVLAFNVLSTIQDVVVRSSRQPWPPASQPT